MTTKKNKAPTEKNDADRTEAEIIKDLLHTVTSPMEHPEQLDGLQLEDLKLLSQHPDAEHWTVGDQEACQLAYNNHITDQLLRVLEPLTLTYHEIGSILQATGESIAHKRPILFEQ